MEKTGEVRPGVTPEVTDASEEKQATAQTLAEHVTKRAGETAQEALRRLSQEADRPPTRPLR